MAVDNPELTQLVLRSAFEEQLDGLPEIGLRFLDRIALRGDSGTTAIASAAVHDLMTRWRKDGGRSPCETSPMTAEELARSADEDEQPADGLPDDLRALWLARKGRWDAAHDLCQEVAEPAGAWIHAWLHRQEGDYGNACYWYSRADQPAKPRDFPLEDEWHEIAAALVR